MVRGAPLLLNVVELRRAVGNQREVHESVALEDLALQTVRVEVGSELSIDLLLEAVSGGVSAAGTLAGRWSGECRRCLERVDGDLVVDVAEVFEDRPTEGETYPIDGDTLDLEPMVRDLVLLALPINPLCRDDCAGPVSDELPVTVEADEEPEHRPDPRWAALDALRLEEPSAGPGTAGSESAGPEGAGASSD